MKNFSALFFLLTLICLNASAQVYTQGDLTLIQMPTTAHDSTTCATAGQMVYQITVQNSFVGDVVEIKDTDFGMTLFTLTNNAGDNPWNIFQPLTVYYTIIPDNQIVGGYANFWNPTTKVISGTDTIYDVMNFFSAFVPDPCEYSTISGSVFVDYNDDCTFNGTDLPLAFVPLAIEQELNSPSQSMIGSGTSSDSDGLFNGVAVQQSWMTSTTVSLPSYYSFIFPLSPCFPGAYTFSTLPQNNLDFALQCSSNIDVQCYVGTPPAARPGIPFMVSPFVNNTGCDAASGVLTLILDPNVMYDASQSIYPADAVNGDTLTWNYSNLSNLSNGMYWNSFMSSIHLTPNTTVNIGDTLCFHVYSNVPAADINASNNDYSVCIPVVNSYDPNIKEVSPAGIGPTGLILQSTTEFTYTIHFQNTGTAPAYNVSIVDTFGSLFNPASLKIIGASHAMTPEWISNNVVRFNFNNINLPDSTSNEPASHGFVTFKIETNNVFPVGTQLTNTAYIYFDFNPAIVTNTTLNTIGEPNAIASVGENALVDVFPNPADETFYISNPIVSTKGYELRIENCIGQIVYETIAREKLHQVDVTAFGNGLYFVHMTDVASGKTVVRKVVVN